MNTDIVGIALIIVLAGSAAFILWRYPDFRRSFMAHWRPNAVARRLNEHTAALRRRHRTEEEALQGIREHLAALGAPVDHLTDDELKAKVIEMQKAIRRAGISAREAHRQMQQLAELRRGVNWATAVAIREVLAREAAARTPPR